MSLAATFYSAKTGAGKQEITLYGDGRVQLFLTRSSQDKSPKVLEGRCEPAAILRLLDLMEGLGVFGLLRSHQIGRWALSS